ncbi:MAG TPA: DUF3108 domain-containing protein [Bryobacteraceae bacterium]|nr:DUF3108 domain-containing protein [Bryobacteraceae bacterium]
MRLFAGISVFLAAWWLPAQSPARHAPSVTAAAAPDPKPAEAKPPSETLTFDVEWRLIHAGTVAVETQKNRAGMHIDSAGMVASLFKVHDVYSSDFEDGFCATSTLMDSQENKRHHEAKVTYDRSRNRASYLERDLVKDTVLHTDDVAIPNCVHEVIGGLLKLRSMSVDPGQSTQIPMSDGRRSAEVKVEAQMREDVKTPAGTFKTVRYEAYLLNGVIYTRKGRMQIWLSDDARKLPVQIRLRMNFPIGNITLQLQKEEHS